MHNTRTPVIATTADHLNRLVFNALQEDGPNCDLNWIDVSRIQDFERLFERTAFNGDVSTWNTSQGLNFDSMFAQSLFTGDISNWDVGMALTMTGMFQDSPFNADISRWNVAKVQDMNRMFKNSPFHGDVSSWNTASLREAESMFESSEFHGDVAGWNVSKLNNTQRMFCTPSFHGDLSEWRLPSRVLHEAMVHPTFCGILPLIEHYDMHDAGAKMLGGVGQLNAYALRAPFGPVHAQLLVADPTRCSWASREEVRWAQEMREMGRAVGMGRYALVQLMVEQKRQGPAVSMGAAGALFESEHGL